MRPSALSTEHQKYAVMGLLDGLTSGHGDDEEVEKDMEEIRSEVEGSKARESSEKEELIGEIQKVEEELGQMGQLETGPGEAENHFDEGDAPEPREEVEEDHDSPAEESGAEPEVPSGENGTESSRIDRIEQRLDEFEEKFVSNDSEELSRISRLEERLEEVELEEASGPSEEDIQQLREEFENKISSMETPQNLDDRLTELEQELATHREWVNGSEIEGDLDGVTEKIDSFEQKIESLEEEIDNVRRESYAKEVEDRVEKLEEGLNREIEMEDRLKAVSSRLEDLEETGPAGSSGEVEELWEAVDEEVSRLEQRISDNEDRHQELMDQVVQLSELVKRGLQ